jgi:4-alpha-glucanotransferase
LYGYLARTPALLIGVNLAEAAGEVRSQNMPGTSDEYPNWKLPLCGPDGAPVMLEDLASSERVSAVARAASGALVSTLPPRHPPVGRPWKDQPR